MLPIHDVLVVLVAVSSRQAAAERMHWIEKDRRIKQKPEKQQNNTENNLMIVKLSWESVRNLVDLTLIFPIFFACLNVAASQRFLPAQVSACTRDAPQRMSC